MVQPNESAKETAAAEPIIIQLWKQFLNPPGGDIESSTVSYHDEEITFNQVSCCFVSFSFIYMQK